MKPFHLKSQQDNSLFDSVHSQQISITHSYQTKNPQQQTIFSQPTYQAKVNARRILATQIKSVGNDQNANFKALATVFLKIIFQTKKNFELLNLLKCTLDKKQINLASIKNRPERNINNSKMKKILNDYFEILKVKSQELSSNKQIETLQLSQNSKGVVVQTIQHHPIILQIMTLFFRTLLLPYNSVHNIDNYMLSASTEQAFYIICEIFDINCRMFGCFFQFIQDGLFICSHDNNQFVFGVFYSNEMELRKAQPNLAQSINLYLKEKAEKQQAKIILSLQQSSQSENSKSSESASGFGYIRNTPFFTGEGETPCFGKRDQQSNFNFQRKKDAGSKNQMTRKLSNSNNTKKSNNSNNQQISIIESEEQLVKNHPKYSQSIKNIQIQSPIDGFQTNPISPTTWSQFTNRLKQIKVRQQEQMPINNRKASNKNSNLYENALLNLPTNNLYQIKQKRKNSIQYNQKNSKDISASYSNKSNTPQKHKSNPFLSSCLDSYQIKKNEEESNYEKFSIQQSKSHEIRKINYRSKELIIPQMQHTKSLSNSQNKQSKNITQKCNLDTKFPYQAESKSRKIKNLNCECRAIKKQRINLNSNIYSVQIISSQQYPFKGIHNVIYEHSKPSLISSKQKKYMNNSPTNINSSTFFKKKYKQYFIHHSYVPNISLINSANEGRNYHFIYQPALSNRKSQTISPDTPKDREILENQKQYFPSTFNYKGSNRLNKIKQSKNQFHKIFGNKKRKMYNMHCSTQLQQNLLSSNDELLHYSSKPNLNTFKRKSQFNQKTKSIRFQKIKNRQQYQRNLLHLNKNNQFNFKSAFRSNYTRFHPSSPKMKLRQSEENPICDKIQKKVNKEIGKKRKLSDNAVSPESIKFYQNLFSSQSVNKDLLKHCHEAIKQKQKINKNIPFSKAFILNKEN